jgi:hypothetical protein
MSSLFYIYVDVGKPADIAKHASIHVVTAGIECRFLMWFVFGKRSPRLPLKAERVEMASSNVGYLFGSSYNMTGITYRLAVPVSLCGSKFPPRSLGDW